MVVLKVFDPCLLVTLHLPHPGFGTTQTGLRSSTGLRNLQHVCVCQGVLICALLLARHSSQNSQKTKEWRQSGYSYCTAWLLGTFHASVAVETQHRHSLWRVTTNLTLESWVCALAEVQVDIKRPFLSATPAAVILQLTALSDSFTHVSSVKVQLKQARIVWIRRLFSSLRVCF